MDAQSAKMTKKRENIKIIIQQDTFKIGCCDALAELKDTNYFFNPRTTSKIACFIF